MRWEAWVAILVHLADLLAVCSYVGRRRPMVTAGYLAGGVLQTAFETWLVLRLAGVS